MTLDQNLKFRKGRSGKPGRPFFIWRIAMIAVALCAMNSLRAQSMVQDYRSVSATQVAPGVRTGVVLLNSQRGATRIRFVEASTTAGPISLEPVLPREGPMASARLEDLGSSVSARAVAGVEFPPAEGDPLQPEGLVWARGKLSQWPPRQRWHLVSFADGSCDLRQLQSLSGTVAFDDGTSLSLTSVNGLLPTESTTASVYTGTFTTSDSPILQWPENLVGVVLSPVRDGADPTALLTEKPDTERRFQLIETRARPEFSCEPGRALLVVTSPLGEAIARTLRAENKLTITVNIPADQQAANFILPTGPPLLLAGAMASGVDPGSPVTNVVAIDATGKRVVLAAPMDLHARGPDLTALQLCDYLSREKFVNANYLPAPVSALISNVADDDQQKETGSMRARTALAITSRTPSLLVPGIESDLYAVRGLAIQGTRREFPANMTRALTDQRTAPSPELAQFWAIPFVRTDALAQLRENPNQLLIVLPKAVPIGVVEIIHADSAGFSPSFNLKHFRISGREKSDAPWRPLADVNHDAPVSRDRVSIPGTPKILQMRLEVVEPSFMPGGDVARIGELIVWATEAGL